jgi:hypothetical protein
LGLRINWQTGPTPNLASRLQENCIQIGRKNVTINRRRDSGEATVPLDKGAAPDDGDVKAAAEAAADTAIDSVKKVFATKLKD